MKRAAFLLAALGLLAISARAALTVTLAPGAQNAARGTEVVFAGTLTNTNASGKIFLNDLHATLSGAAAVQLSLKTNDFFANVPGILLPGESYTGPLFRIALGAAAPAADYTGTITFDGGADIFATANLASSGFTLLSPAVNLVATDPSAAELGPDSGTFTITRTGGTGIALPFVVAITGTAVNGTTYSAITPALTIASGAAATTVTITPLADNLAQGDRLATLSLSPSAAFNAGANTTASVTIHDKPADAWRFQKFGANANAPAAADTADWDRDGTANLVEYALDLAPQIPDRAALPVPFFSGGYLTFSYVPNATATDVLYAVQASTNFATWSAADVESVTIANPSPPNRVTVRYKNPVSLTSRVFLRLSITRP